MDQPEYRRRSTAEQTINAEFKSLFFAGDGAALIQYMYEGTLCSTVLANPEILKGGIFPGTRIDLTLTPSPAGGIFGMTAAVHLSEKEFFPINLLLLLSRERPFYRTEIGLITKPDDEGTGRYYLSLSAAGLGEFLGTGTYELHENDGSCDAFDGFWPVDSKTFDRYCDRDEWEVLTGVQWRHPQLDMAPAVPQVKIGDMTKGYREAMVRSGGSEYVETDDWSPLFYRTQAKLGFIAVARKLGRRITLLPELQESYAVLDCEKVSVDRGVRNILQKGIVSDGGVELKVSSDPGQVIDELHMMWGDSSWLYPPYTDLVRKLASKEERKRAPGFRIWAVTLEAAGEPAAGELGYTVGNTYTSLSGFFHRERREWNHYGKLQMVLLSRHLQGHGIGFWNLGHPYMDYKLRLGAEIMPRREFLELWDDNCGGDSPDLAL